MAQLVRAPPCHGGGRGFEPHPGRLYCLLWDLSSAGRASALQAEGHRFEPCRSHYQNQSMSCRCGSMAEQLICNQQVIGSSPIIGFGIKPNNMGEFPSGQRGQTVNLLQIASVVRIHRHPMKQYYIAGWSSLEARRAHNPKVIGSNPIPATNGFVILFNDHQKCSREFISIE